MNAPISLEIETKSAKLELLFSSLPDRWQHELKLNSGGQSTLLMSSVEGDDVEIWPPSPPLQEVSWHELPTGPAVLSVGMAGRNHWSASYSVSTIESQPRLIVDLAAKLQTKVDAPGHNLRSTYLVHQAGRWVGSERFEIDLGELQIVFTPIHGCRFEQADGRFVVRPDKVSNTAKQAVQWGFEISIG